MCAEQLQIGESATDALNKEAIRMEQQAKQLRTLARDLHDTAARRLMADALGIAFNTEYISSEPQPSSPPAADPAASSSAAPGPDLLKAALLLAHIDNPDVDVNAYVARMDEMAEELKRTFPENATELQRLAALDKYLFEELGMRGSQSEYYTRSNSYLNEVIDRRTGIPITLAVLYMELGRRVGLPLEGVSFPGHFLVRLRMRHGMLVLDPFCGGAPLAMDDLRERLKRVVPEAAAAPLAVDDLPLDSFLEPADKRQILGRVLRNLKGVYLASDRYERALEVLNRLCIVAPDSGTDLRDRGLVYERLECWRPALDDLRAYIAREPQASDAEQVRARMLVLAARCASLN